MIMRVRATTIGVGLVIGATLAFTTGCSGASFAERMTYLGKVANEGVQTHRLIVSEGGTTDLKRCTDAYNGLSDVADDAPSESQELGSAWMTGSTRSKRSSYKAALPVSPSPCQVRRTGLGLPSHRDQRGRLPPLQHPSSQAKQR